MAKIHGAGDKSDPDTPPCQVIAVFTGPRDEARWPCGSATLDRLIEAYKWASKWDSRIIVTGRVDERTRVEMEMQLAVNRLRPTGVDLQPHAYSPQRIGLNGANHTVGNVVETIYEVLEAYDSISDSGSGTPQVRVGIVSHGWHLPRIKADCEAVLQCFRIGNPLRLEAVKIEFVYIPASSTMDRRVEKEYIRQEEFKRRNDLRRLRRWKERLQSSQLEDGLTLFPDAPTVFTYVVRPDRCKKPVRRARTLVS